MQIRGTLIVTVVLVLQKVQLLRSVNVVLFIFLVTIDALILQSYALLFGQFLQFWVHSIMSLQLPCEVLVPILALVIAVVFPVLDERVSVRLVAHLRWH